MKSTIIITFLVLRLFSIAQAQDTTHISSIDYLYDTDTVKKTIFKSYPTLRKKITLKESFVPIGWKLIDSISGNLNGDKLTDLAMVIEHIEVVNEKLGQDLEWEANPRILLIWFKGEKEDYSLVLQNNYILPRAGMGKQGGDPFEKLIIKNSTLTLNGVMGENFIFAFKNKTFYLVAAFANRMTVKGYFITYQMDFLKHKAKVETILGDGEKKRTFIKSVNLPSRRLLNLRTMKEFNIGKIFERVHYW